MKEWKENMAIKICISLDFAKWNQQKNHVWIGSISKTNEKKGKQQHGNYVDHIIYRKLSVIELSNCWIVKWFNRWVVIHHSNLTFKPRADWITDHTIHTSYYKFQSIIFQIIRYIINKSQNRFMPRNNYD